MYSVVMNPAVKIFHINGVNPERDSAYALLNTSLAIPRLDTPTVSTPPDELTFLREFKTGEMGLWGSTYLALKSFLESDHDVLLILEDDVELRMGFLDTAAFYLSELPSDWDFFYQFVHWWQQDNRYNSSYEYGHPTLCKAYQVWGNGCFWISRNGASKVLYEVLKDGIEEPTDWFILKRGLEGLYNNYTLKPGVDNYCGLLNFETTIQMEN